MREAVVVDVVRAAADDVNEERDEPRTATRAGVCVVVMVGAAADNDDSSACRDVNESVWCAGRLTPVLDDDDDEEDEEEDDDCSVSDMMMMCGVCEQR